MTNTKFNAYTAVKLQCDFDYGLPRRLQRVRSAKSPAQLATSTECEVPRAGNDVSVYFYKKPRNL